MPSQNFRLSAYSEVHIFFAVEVLRRDLASQMESHPNLYTLIFRSDSWFPDV